MHKRFLHYVYNPTTLFGAGLAALSFGLILFLFVMGIFSSSKKPYMRTDWKHFPDNISQVYTPGCFRCHDRKHVDDDGKVISNDCNSCHIFISQTMNDGTIKTSLDGLEFKHPVDLGESLKQLLCTDCHWKQS